MNAKVKSVLLLLLAALCIYGIHLSLLEVQQEDFYIWGESSNPPREWLLFLSAPCSFVLLWVFGWTLGQLLKWLVARHYGLE
jgi:hypothetical protein